MHSSNLNGQIAYAVNSMLDRTTAAIDAPSVLYSQTNSQGGVTAKSSRLPFSRHRLGGKTTQTMPYGYQLWLDIVRHLIVESRLVADACRIKGLLQRRDDISVLSLCLAEGHNDVGQRCGDSPHA